MSGIDETGTLQCLTFKLSEEIFAVDVSRVSRVLDLTRITKVPQTPDYMKGVINYMGNVVPIVDLKLKFGMGETEKSVDTCIVMMEIDLDQETTVLGGLADSVQEVIDLEADQIEPAPKIGTRLNTEFIRGMGKKDEDFIIILDIDKVFSLDELSVIKASGEEKVLAEKSE